jgi:hypothetical protein
VAEGNRPLRNPRVAQAQGMVSVQVPCTLDEALLLLNARARTGDQTVEQVATAVVAGDIRFDE